MFNLGYAHLYDTLYKTKCYKDEVNFLKSIYEVTVVPPLSVYVKTILDIACGTGEHLRHLKEAGYDVMGIDCSKDMLEIAKTKLKCPIEQQDMTSFKINRKFDSIIAMFNSVGYVKDLPRVFANVKDHLVHGGLFIFDFWNKKAVQYDYEPYRASWYGEGEYPKYKRESYSKIVDEDVMEVEFLLYSLYDCGDIDWNQSIIREKHLIYYYDPEDIKVNLEMAGFGVELFPFMDNKRKIDSRDWTIQCVARRLQ